ncbi:Bifunctional purine biosynthesis protein purH [Thalassoporum mexicanum PCC 7367]|uniref:bifunctional phosphoribosylaminoimidazolecarboxamide formyltransferase/IMP cyclohydrolase n=1 Tax=Thalassoporum mexicanum TaxID=3457544 RepID=UPI00029F93EF|nr:Bifunctional purine biosynthesis protein purH [Pseudanabaena sp. PCC 7367]
MTRIALLSTSDKTGLVNLARTLVEKYQFQLISSGGTAKVLAEANLPVTKVSDYTGAPEILGGRVKTLHPKVHGGILAQTDLAQDNQDLQNNQIQSIALVVVNLYPFEQTIAQEHVSLEEAIEQIDIGGPTLIRAAAKNHKHVTILSSPDQYAACLDELEANGGETRLKFRRSLALAAFQHTQAYDLAISNYLTGQFGQQAEDELAKPNYELSGHNPKVLRYGENPHQPATWYQSGSKATGWSAAQQLQGKELSYNNLLDLEAARRIVAEFVADRPSAVLVKHNNPCGVAIADDLVIAYQKALAADSISAFGGIVALNRAIDAATAAKLTETFLECVVAPACKPAAQEILQRKSKLRVLTLPDLAQGTAENVRLIAGGLLVQKSDQMPIHVDDWQIATKKQPTADQMEELMFAWRVVRHVKSNAILVSRDRQTLGIGAGQMNRVGAAQIALSLAAEKPGQAIQGAVLASDGFLPFDDTVKAAAAAGITAIIQPGGSIRDQDSIQAADELGMVMVLTGVRHFLH